MSFPVSKSQPLDNVMPKHYKSWQLNFPVFSVHPQLKYLDSAATCLIPAKVADAIHHYQCFEHANSHKGLYSLSANATKLVDDARAKITSFIGAQQTDEIMFTSGTTHAINQVAQGFVKSKILALTEQGKVANIIISESEHHANILPWQVLAKETGAQLRIIKLNSFGTVDLHSLKNTLDNCSVIVAINHVSNVLGTTNPIQNICNIAHDFSVPVLVDGAQAIGHISVDVNQLNCDFYAFSAHKMYGPTGIGVLFTKEKYLDQMEPYIVGGGIVSKSSFTETQLLPAPLKFEAGSHNVAGIVGLSAAVDFLREISITERQNHFKHLSSYLLSEMIKLNFVQPLISFDHQSDTTSIFSFVVEGVHCHDIASFLAGEDIAVRAGHHCAEPLHRQLAVNASIRVSFGLYNNKSDIDCLITVLQKAYQLLVIK